MRHVPAWAAAVMTALGLGLAFPGLPPGLPLLVLLHPAGAALLGTGSATGGQAFLRAWAASSLGHALALYWLYVPMLKVGGLPLPAAVGCGLLVCLALATQAGVFAAVCRRFWRPALARSALAMGLVWYFLEWAYALAAGFPWLPLSGALAPWSWTMQAADTLGATLTASLWAAAALGLAGAALTRAKTAALASLLLAGILTGYGLLTLAQQPVQPQADARTAARYLPAPDPDPDVFPVLLVEGNIDQNQKWVEAYRTSTVKTYSRLTLEAVQRMRGADADAQSWMERGVILWPETAMPFDVPTSRHSLDIQAVNVAVGMALATGAPATERGPDGRPQVFNRVWLIDSEGRLAGAYDKEHLVPFGEYVPSFFRWDFLAGLLQEVGAYTEGTRTAPLHAGRLAMGPLVCYEAVFPWLAQERVAQGANVLVDVSNDGWFGDTAAPWQHLWLTALRALEQNRWLVRCTNTGISAVYDNRGRIVFQGPQFQAGALWASARVVQDTSRFHKIFYLLPILCALLLAGCIWSTARNVRQHAADK